MNTTIRPARKHVILAMVTGALILTGATLWVTLAAFADSGWAAPEIAVAIFTAIVLPLAVVGLAATLIRAARG